MAIVLGIALPAFDAFKQRGTQSAIPQLMSTLRLRSTVCHHSPPGCLRGVSGRRSLAYAPAGEVTKALCSYAVIASNRANNRFEYVTEWKYLPKGIYFDDDLAMTNNVFSSSLTNFHFRTMTGQYRNLPAVQFRPNGRAYRGQRR